MKKTVNGVDVEMTAEEEAAFLADQQANAPTSQDIIKQQIAALELANPITPRAQRELALMVDQIVLQLTGAPVNSVGMQRARDLEAQIATLRAKL